MTDQFNDKKRHHDKSPKSEPMRQKRNKNGDSVETKTITNIYYDCLERIFDFLDIKSLLMVANTCKRLQIAAAAKFGDEYGGKKILLYPNDEEPMVIVEQSYIAVQGLKLCLVFLRCFGAKISDLRVTYYDLYLGLSRTTEEYLDEYINQYCANTLTSIDFYKKSQFSNDAFKNPFKNIQNVQMMCCGVGNQLPTFVNWFPNVRYLEIIDCSFYEHALMKVCFPHLEHLLIRIKENPYKFCIEDAANLLHANPQLRNLTIWWWSTELTLSKILDAISANSLITKLQVTDVSQSVINVNLDELNRFVAEHPVAEELFLKDHYLTVDDAIDFIRQMNALKRIGFQVKDQPECDLLLKQLENEWKSKVSTDNRGLFIELMRK